MSQQQKGGSGSTNIQIGTVSTGLTYSDVRDIASDLFKANFANLMAMAKDTAEARAAEIRDEIIDRLEKDKQANPQSFSQVEKQVLLLEAQKAYAVSGDDELKDILINAVIGASGAPERSKKSIVLGEAIKIAPLLTKNQIKALGISFAIRFVNFPSTNINQLFDTYLRAINLTEKHIDLTAGDIRHMEYLGCGTMGLSHVGFYDILKGDYHGLLCAGFSGPELQAAFHPEPLPQPMRTCHRDQQKLEIATHRQDVIDGTMWTPHQKTVAKQKIQERLIDEQALIRELENHSEISAYLYKQWQESNLSNFQLTSAGIAIGHTYVADRVQMGDLDIWL